MAWFRKKPMLVMAEQWLGPGSLTAGVQREWVPTTPDEERGYYRYYVVTAHGQKIDVAPRDWVIDDPDGRGQYPCRPDIFEGIYEKAEE